MTTAMIFVLAATAVCMIFQAARYNELEDRLVEAEHSAEERIKLLEHEVRLLAEEAGHMKTEMSDVKGDMQEHDRDFEKFLEGMGNLMNYSVEVAMHGKPEDDD